MKWYKGWGPMGGKTVLEQLDSFETENLPEDKPFRMPVQDVYKFTRDGDNRRIVAGTIDTGSIKAGDEVVFYPSGKKSKVLTLEEFNRDGPLERKAGNHLGFTMQEQIYVRRGEIATVNGEPKPKVSTRLKANIFWLGREPMIMGKEYYLKIGTQKLRTKIEKIHLILDASTLGKSQKNRIERHDVAEITLKTEKAATFDLAQDSNTTSRFVVVDDYEITGGGIITEAVEDRQNWVRDKVLIRNYKWIKSAIARENRAEKYNQKASLILITGQKDTGRKEIAKALEERLFQDGKFVYYLGIGNILYGVDADIKEEGKDTNRKEHLRRMAEVAHIMLDSGMILVVTAIELKAEDVDIIETIVDPDLIETIWVGKDITSGIEPDLHITETDDKNEAMDIIKSRLQDKGLIFRPF